MDRKGQLANVAFGGAWSERIPRRERLVRALELAGEAAVRAVEEDLRCDQDLAEAVRMLCAAHPRGAQLGTAWERALSIGAPAARQQEIARISSVLRAWHNAN